MITRRALLLGGLGLTLAACSGLPDGVPDVSTGTLVSGSFRSRYRRTDVGWAISYPPGNARRLPVLVFLHGRGGDHNAAFGGSLQLDRFLASAVDHGARRIGLMGNSMGGYGTLYLAEALGRTRVAVAVAESPAIWHEAGQTVEGAFDDPADFAAHTVFGPRLHRLGGIALRIDCGASDGFAPITRDLRARIRPTPAGGIEAGQHDSTYWRRMAPAQLRFVGAHL